MKVTRSCKNSICAKLLHQCQTLCVTSWAIVCQAPLSIGFSREEYWSGLSCPSPEDLPDPEIEHESLKSLALSGKFFTISVGLQNCLMYFD